MKYIPLLLALSLPVLAQDRKPNKPDPTARVVVHEWGVAAVAQGAGRALVGASGPADGDLPDFITQLPTLGMSGGMTVRQPIVYFYSDKPTTFSYSVRFPSGYPICFDPPATTWANTRDYQKPGNGYLSWQGRIDPQSEASGPAVSEGHWVARCRDVDAACIRIGGRTEKYLFYEGVLSLSCPATLRVEGMGVSCDRGGWTAPAMAVRVRGGKVETFVVRDSGMLAPEPVSLESMLIDAGLYPKEAAAVLAIWRDHFFRRDGLRLLTLIQGPAYDELLPADICPKPAEVKRVLVLCVDFPTPELDEIVARQVEALYSFSLDDRDAATRRLIELGPVAMGPLSRHADAADSEVRARIASVVQKLSQPLPTPKPVPIRPKSR